MTLLWRAFWRLCFSAVPEYSAERMKHNEIPDGDAEAKSRQFRSLPLKMQMKIGAKHAKGSRHSVEVVAMSLHLLPQQLHLIRTSDRLRDVGISPSPVVCHLLAASQRAKNKRCAATVRCLRRIQSTERRGTVSPSSHSRNGRTVHHRPLSPFSVCLSVCRAERKGYLISKRGRGCQLVRWTVRWRMPMTCGERGRATLAMLQKSSRHRSDRRAMVSSCVVFCAFLSSSNGRLSAADCLSVSHRILQHSARCTTGDSTS